MNNSNATVATVSHNSQSSQTSGHNNTTAQTNQSSHEVITNAQEKTIRDALAALVSVVSHHGAIPVLAIKSDDDMKQILNRTFTAIVEKNKSRFAELMAEVPAHFAALVQEKRDEASVILAEFAEMSPKVREMVKATIPTYITLTFSELAACFPQGASDAEIVKGLSDMGVKLGASKEIKKPTMKDYFTRLPLA